MTPPDSLRLAVSDALRAAERDATNHTLPERRRARARNLVHRLDEVLDELRQADADDARGDDAGEGAARFVPCWAMPTGAWAGAEGEV